ncbi:hypothetical protein N7526_000343 [Penicillium atrosanguineum]|nr:hypothetical protein N7526_000343 [Penicillium atrosanguineum]
MTAKTTIQLPVGPITALATEGIIHARGIPYAKANRFEAPQPADQWTEARDCTDRASICPQLSSRLESVMGPLTEGHSLNEDCLHLTITAPNDATNAPVMIWLHGGAYISGGGDLDCYQPAGLTKRGIVFSDISGLEGIASANLGLLDQRAALQWIQNNVTAFGGNSENITIVGQSAGADSIICLMVAEGTEGLFHRAILLSPPLRELKERTPTAALLSKKAEQFFTKDPRDMSVDELLVVQKKLLMNPVKTQVMLFAPTLGSDPLPAEQEFDQKLSEIIKDIPILIGWTANDGRPFASMMGPQSLLKLPIIGPYVESLGTWYITQSYFKWPSQSFHEQVLQAGGTSTSYSFGWAGEGNPLGSCHCIDIPFVLGREGAWKNAPMLAGKSTEEYLARLGSDIKDLWTSFASGKMLKSGLHIEFDGEFVLSQDVFFD